MALDLGDELTRRLRVHGTMTGRSESDVVRELIEHHIPRYRVQTLTQAPAPLAIADEAA